jgi:Protein of unknown function (DUF2924)
MPRAVTQSQKEKLTKGLSGLAMLSDADLRARWQDLYGIEPPPRIDRSLLIPAIAHRMQEQTLGGLSSSARRHLMRFTSGAVGSGQPWNHLGLSPRPGTAFKPTRRFSIFWFGTQLGSWQP